MACGLYNRKFTCSFSYYDTNYRRMDLSMSDAADILIGKWVYVSFLVKQQLSVQNMQIFIFQNHNILSQSTATITAPINTGVSIAWLFSSSCTAATQAFYIRDVRGWLKRRGMAEIMMQLNNELMPIDHRLLHYYSPLNNN